VTERNKMTEYLSRSSEYTISPKSWEWLWDGVKTFRHSRIKDEQWGKGD